MVAQDRHIVVGFDGSEPAAAALDWAAAEAQRRDLVLTILLSVEDQERGPVPAGAVHRLGLTEPAAKELAAESIRRARRSAGSIEIAVTTRIGTPSRALIECSRHAELIVVGAHGRNREPGDADGPVALAVSAHAHCPVKVVHS